MELAVDTSAADSSSSAGEQDVPNVSCLSQSSASSSSSSGFATPLGSPPAASPSPLEQLCRRDQSDSARSAGDSAELSSKSSGASASASGSASSGESSVPTSDSEDAGNALPVMTRAQVKAEAFARDRCLLVIGEFVYDVTGFMRMHPGGREILQENAGSDATNAFNSTHSARARRMLARYCVGRLPSRSSNSSACKKPAALLEAVRDALQEH